MSKTETKKYRFTVKESSSGKPRLVLEPSRETLQVLGNGILGLNLQPGATIEDAQEIANFINDNIVSVSYTDLYS